MHALHHPNLPRAVTVTLIAAVLAIVLTLGLATSLNDLASTPAPTSTASTPPVVRARNELAMGSEPVHATPAIIGGRAVGHDSALAAGGT